jgi:hypothetical protein
MNNCSDIDCSKNLDKTCTADKCIFNTVLKAIPSKNGCKGCIGYDDCEVITEIANRQKGLKCCTGKNIIYVEVN